MTTQDDVISILQRLFASRDTAVKEEEMLGFVLAQLRKMARGFLANRGKTPSFETDDLVSEVAVVLFKKEPPVFQNWIHFERWSRQVIIRLHADHWRRKSRGKRSPGGTMLSINDVDPADPYAVAELNLPVLFSVLDQMAKEEPDLMRIVTHRVLLDHSVAETAGALGVSERTVKRHARAAKAWLGEKIG